MNVLWILSDQHNPRFTGCYGHPFAQTPHIDALAARGLRFEQAWCPSPLCVPCRASLFTGRYVFEHGCWDNCIAWDGRLPGWPAHLADHGVHLTTIGKLDFAPGQHRIAEPILPAYRTSRDIHSLFRADTTLPPRWQEADHLAQAGPRDGLTLEKTGGWQIAERACRWLAADRPADRPWILNVNFLEPHPPWPCPPDLWEKWQNRVQLKDLPPLYFEPPENLHPFHRNYAHHSTGLYTAPEEVLRGYIAYLVHCEIVDTLVGRVLSQLAALNLLEDTLVIYSSDHGENCRAHGQWGKMNMYEEALRVPLILAGPPVPPAARGTVIAAPVELLDVLPTACAAAGAPLPADLRGVSLLPLLQNPAAPPPHEYVFSEYHANGAPAGAFAVSDGRWKYVECVGARGMLFDLAADRDELHDLLAAPPAARPAAQEFQTVVARLRGWLCRLLSPVAVDLRAKQDQAHLRRAMERDGTLADEIFNRGYERRADTLVPRANRPAAQRGQPS